MRIIHAAPLAACLLAACAATGAPDEAETAAAPASAAEEKPVSIMGTSTDRMYNGDYSSPMWLSHAFDGEQSRRFEGDTLVLTVRQAHPEGGLDTALATADGEEELPDVAAVSEDLTVCFAYDVDLTGDGHWWAGPKISVGWNRDAEVETEGWYETYVVELADDDPATVEARMIDYFDARFIGETEQDGGTYRHFAFPFETWTQFWAIRQDYREAGATSIGPILSLWQQHGLPSDGTFDGVKVNIETYGDMAGEVRIDADIPMSYANPPARTCADA